MSTYDKCTACTGSGRRSIRLGRPDPERDTHETYKGPWCVYPETDCDACLGTGWRKIRQYGPERTTVIVGGEQMSMDDIIKMVGDSPTEGIPT